MQIGQNRANLQNTTFGNQRVRNYLESEISSFIKASEDIYKSGKIHFTDEKVTPKQIDLQLRGFKIVDLLREETADLLLKLVESPWVHPKIRDSVVEKMSVTKNIDANKMLENFVKGTNMKFNSKTIVGKAREIIETVLDKNKYRC